MTRLKLLSSSRFLVFFILFYFIGNQRCTLFFQFSFLLWLAHAHPAFCQRRPITTFKQVQPTNYLYFLNIFKWIFFFYSSEYFYFSFCICFWSFCVMEKYLNEKKYVSDIKVIFEKWKKKKNYWFQSLPGSPRLDNVSLSLQQSIGNRK